MLFRLYFDYFILVVGHLVVLLIVGVELVVDLFVAETLPKEIQPAAYYLPTIGCVAVVAVTVHVVD